MPTTNLKYLSEQKSLKWGEYNRDSRIIAFDIGEKINEFSENIRYSCPFLQQINFFYVPYNQGKKIINILPYQNTGRKEDGRHFATIPNREHQYELFETDSGIIIPWQLFDQFAYCKEKLEALYDNYFFTQLALDLLQIGWNGSSVAKNTTDENLKDVNKGWLVRLKEQKPENFIQNGKTANNIKIFGENADYSSLDELAIALRQKLAPHHQNRTDLVLLVGLDLITKEKNLILKDSNQANTSILDSHHLLNIFGGLPAIIPPNFPLKGAVVTTLQNLSIYTFMKSGRYSLRSDENRKAIISSYYRQEGYVVEDLSLIAAIDHTKVILG